MRTILQFLFLPASKRSWNIDLVELKGLIVSDVNHSESLSLWKFKSWRLVLKLLDNPDQKRHWNISPLIALSCMSFDCLLTSTSRCGEYEREKLGKAFYHVNVSSETRNDKVISFRWRMKQHSNDTSFTLRTWTRFSMGYRFGQNHLH